MPYVYRHDNAETGEFYIGFRRSSTDSPIDDLSKYICSSSKVKTRIKLDGCWKSSILMTTDDYVEAYWYEQEQIKLGFDNPLILNEYYMDKDKGHRVFLHFEKTDNHKEKISNALKSHTRTKEHNENISKSLIGRKLSPEVIQKRTDSITGQKRTDEQRQNISNSLKGHIVSDLTKEKISRSKQGKPQPKGKDSPCSKPILCVNTNQIFYSQTEAAMSLGIKQGDVNNVLRGRQKSTKGYIFVYV